MDLIPESVSSAVHAAIADAMAAFQVPGMVVVMALPGLPISHIISGTDAVGQPMRDDSLFPVASITKLATALTILRLVDGGAINLDAPLRQYLPDAEVSRVAVTPRMLMCHVSGLPLEIPTESAMYQPGLTWTDIGRASLATKRQWPPEARVQYSNVGYNLLAIVAEQVTGEPFPHALQRLVLRPLGIEGYLGIEPARPPVVLADVRSPHAGTQIEPFNSPFWRSLALPSSGLITTPGGALALVRAYLDTPADFLSVRTRTDAAANQTNHLSGGFTPPLVWRFCPWGLGPDILDDKKPHWAPISAGPNSFGHAGASGSFVWCSPSADISWAILGARTADNGWLLRRVPAISDPLFRL